MDSDASLLAEHTARLRKIIAKKKRGQTLGPKEREFLGERATAAASEARSYDSIGAAAAALGVSVAVLRKAKRAGAPGFRGSRVYPADLLPWLERGNKARGPAFDEKEVLELKLLRVKIERQEFAFAAERGEYVLASEAARWATELVTEFTKTLEAVPSTLAPDIVGVPSIAEAERRIRAALDAVRRTLHEGQWS